MSDSPPTWSLPDPAGLVPQVLERVGDAARGLEFTSYFLGVRARRLEKRVPEEVFEGWKAEVRRRVGFALGLAWEPLGRITAPVNPDLLAIWDHDTDRVESRIRALFVYGRYTKEARGVSQTRATWPCKACLRAGCEACLGTGLLYPHSVEALLAGPVAAALDADPARAQLHGAGREDGDVRCLGAGRPFVLEVQAPRRRTVDLAALAAEVERASGGRLGLPGGLRFVDGRLVARVKGWPARKVYRATVEAEGPLDAATAARAAATLTGTSLEQRTPLRVARRRSDLVRRRTVRTFELLEAPAPTRLVARVEADAGTYIKELISGDEGRTTPSLASLLGVPCRCAELDVLEVAIDEAALLGDGPAPARQAEDEAISDE